LIVHYKQNNSQLNSFTVCFRNRSYIHIYT